MRCAMMAGAMQHAPRIPFSARRASSGRPLSWLLWSWLVYWLVAVPASTATAADDAARWIPSLTFHSGLTGFNVQAGVESTERGRQDGDGRLVMPFVAPGLELASPELSDWPARPRLFIHGGPELLFDLERAIAKEGDPGEVTVFTIDPDGPTGPAPPIFPGENNVTGVGSETLVQANTLSWGAGIGVSFSFSIWRRTLHVKPSFEYRYDELEVSTGMSTARSASGNGFCPCRTVSISATDTKAFHAIGPGIELELDGQRAGPMIVTAFMSAQGYYVLGDRFASVEARGNFTTGEPASVVSTLRRSPWTLRGGVGLRVRWQPE